MASASVIAIAPSDAGIAAQPQSYLGASFKSYIEATKRAGLKFDGQKSQVGPVTSLPRLIEELKSVGFEVTLDPTLRPSVEKARDQVQHVLDTTMARVERIQARLLSEGKSLRPYQIEDIARMATMDRCLNANEMGLGKTLEAILSAPDDAPMLVVCPSVAKGVWRREVKKWRPELTVTVLDGERGFRWPEKGEMVVISWACLPPTLKELNEKKAAIEFKAAREKRDLTGKELAKIAELESWMAFSIDKWAPSCPVKLVLISDEAQAIKNSKSLRTQRYRFLARTVRTKDGKNWPMTGTPILNRAQELWNLLVANGMEKETFTNWNGFLDAFNGHPGRWGGYEFGTPRADVGGILAKVMIRHLKKDVLPQLPPKQRQIIPIPLSAASGKLVKILDKAWKTAQDLGLDQDGDALLYALGQNPEFEEYSKCRRDLALLKLPFAVEELEEYEEQGVPLVVACAHVEPLEAIGKREGWGIITGKTPAAKRTEMEDAFQAGKLKGLALSIQAGGVAITLDKGSNMLFIDRDYTPGWNLQCEDRLHRGEQRNPCLYKILALDHPLEHRMAEILREKEELIEASIEQVPLAPVQFANRADMFTAVLDEVDRQAEEAELAGFATPDPDEEPAEDTAPEYSQNIHNLEEEFFDPHF